MSKNISILYVDDEEHNLTTFKTNFRRNYIIHTAISAEEGLAILEKNPVHIVIADQRMPNTTGVEFLNTIREKYIKPIRILLTGYTDISVVIEAINKGSVFRYITKPFTALEVQNTIQNAYELYVTREQLDNKMFELQKTNDELNRFIYSASHDIRSPLTSILSVLELARADKKDNDQNDYLGMIENCIIKVDNLLKKIIEYYRNLRAGHELKESINFNDLIKGSIDLYRVQNPTVNFHVDIKQSIPFLGDPYRLDLIINNIISNAVKYQKKEEKEQAIWVKINVETNKVDIIIKDNGTGIPKEHLDDVFKMFFRYNTTTVGTGIGLFVVKEALDKLGGNINVESTYGEGTTFEISIPNQASIINKAVLDSIS